MSYDLYLMNPHGDPDRDADDDARTIRDRQAAIDRQIDLAPPAPRSGCDRRLVSIFDAGKMPDQPDRFYAAHPVVLNGPSREGGTASPWIDTLTTMYVDVLRGVPQAGDILVATAVAGRWVAEKDGKPKLICRWLCGPYVAIDPPTGAGFNCQAAMASVTVASDGTISGATVISGGSCYTVAHPNAIVKVDGFPHPGAGATLLATVGEVVSLTVTEGGSGYDPANPPDVKIAAPGGLGTTATATPIIVNGSIAGFNITSGGSLYQAANPTVTIGPPGAGGTQATAVATAKPGVVTSIKVQNPGSGYVDNTPPDRLDLTIACSAWSLSMTLLPGAAGPQGTAPAGTLPYCDYGGSATIDIPSSAACPAIPGVTFTAWATFSDRYNGWVLAVNANVYHKPIDPLDADPCLSLMTSGGSSYDTGDGPYGALYLSCSGRPFSWSQHAHSGMQGSQPESAETWWLLGGGYDQHTGTAAINPADPDWDPTPLDFTFTLSEPPPP